MRIVNSKQMREMDHHTIKEIGVAGIVLMENAACAWIEAAARILKGARKIYLFCGAGNNGGDGYAIARNLVNRDYNCLVVAVKAPKSADCIENAKAWDHYGKTINWEEFLSISHLVNDDDLMVDAILGTGIETSLKGDLISTIKSIHSCSAKKIAVDMPSGISASSGDIMGVAIKSDLCITFQKEKIGHHLYPGKSYSGRVVCQDISIKEVYGDSDYEYHLIDKSLVKQLLPKREPDSYKNIFGHVLTWCGTPGTLGAALLASRAALRSGAGLVTAALPKGYLNALLTYAPELMSCVQEEITEQDFLRFNAIVLGCGLGRNTEKWESIPEKINNSKLPVVLDADAFYGIDDLSKLDPCRLVLTPHPGEFAYLSGFPKPANNRERIQQGQQFVGEFPTTLILKGAPSIVFTQDRKMFVNSTGNSGMATAGSGDVLAGMVGGLLAQGVQTDQAAILGAWLHGKSGDLACELYGEEPLTASDIIETIGAAVKTLHTKSP